jgi:Ca-activated chloride channel family protein
MKLLDSFFESLNSLITDTPGDLKVAGSAWSTRRPAAPVDMLVLDASGSMMEEDYRPTRLDGAKQAAIRFLDQRCASAPDACVGIVAFGDSAELVAAPMPVKAHLTELRAAIEGIALIGSTNIAAGVNRARQVIQSNPNRLAPRIVLLTDGHSISGNPEAAAEKAKAAGVQLDIIGIGGSPADVDEDSLRRMASVVNGELRYWFIRSVGELVRKFEFLGLRRTD